MADEWMTTQEAADYLDISQRGVNALIERDRLEAQKFGIQWMISRASVEAYKEEQAARKQKK